MTLSVTGNAGQWTESDSPCVCAKERDGESAALWAGVSLLSSVIQVLMYSL